MVEIIPSRLRFIANVPHIYLGPRFLIFQNGIRRIPASVMYRMSVILGCDKPFSDVGSIFAGEEAVDFSVEKSVFHHGEAMPFRVSLTYDDLVLWKLKYS